MTYCCCIESVYCFEYFKFTVLDFQLSTVQAGIYIG